MTPQSEPVPPLWQEVRRRRVGKVVVAYLALTFGAIEIGIVVLPALSAPEWLWRLLLGAVVMGFPVATVLGWTFDITPKGVVRTPEHLGEAPEDPVSNLWLVLTVFGLLTGFALQFWRR